MTDSPAIDTLLERVAAVIAAQRRLPEATYRIQFHAGFTFRDATRIIPYLRDLGITDLYASPYLKARPGSKHGYDIVDHRQLNPEIGSEADYEEMVRALHEQGLGQVLDIVPNHMGIAGNENGWWNDVLENGPSSPYAGFFDIDWDPVKPQLRGKVLLPILGDPYGKVLESGQIQLHYDGGAFFANYFDKRLPIAPKAAIRVLRHRLEELETRLGKESPEFMDYVSIVTALTHLPGQDETDPAKIEERQREKEVIKRRLAALRDANPVLQIFMDENLAYFNGQVGEARSFDPLDEVLNDQPYRLSFWRVATDETNYRRFFDVNELAALSMEKPEVFEATHELIFRLLREGKVNGLRIDHPDGLFDPRQYLDRLQARYILEMARRLVSEDADCRDMDWATLEPALREAIDRQRAGGPASPLWRPLYVVVEKILGPDEPVPNDWPVYGTTGYEFLNWLNGLFVDPAGARPFTRLYQAWSEIDPSFGELAYQKKFLILQVALSSELHMLARQLDRLSEENRWSRDFTLNALRHTLREIIACFPVYRSYIAEGELHPRDRLYINTAVLRAKRKNPAINASIFNFIRDLLLLSADVMSPKDREEQLRFIGKFQQVTSPVTAKGLEDTAFYNYNRLVSLNEVGGDPGRFGIEVETFHKHNHERQTTFPWGLSATATHDTKRGEDVRARLDVLSEIPQEWKRQLGRWSRLNRRLRVDLEGMAVPDSNDEYFLYQTLLGAWPLDEGSEEQHAEFVERIQQYMQKAIHEAKVHTSWINPNPAYDDAIRRFIDRLLNRRKNRRFLEHFQTFQRRVAHVGLFNSLAQTLLKIASPGVPDTYQGTELWDLSLVDPDNRRPVDYDKRRQLLQELGARLASAEGNRLGLCRELVERKEDGRIKLYVTSRGLRCRREHPGLFSAGEYQPLSATGLRQKHLCAFLRSQDSVRALVVVPLLLAALLWDSGGVPLGAEAWAETWLLLPAGTASRQWHNIFTGEDVTAVERDGQPALPVAQVLGHFPVALFLARQ